MVPVSDAELPVIADKVRELHGRLEAAKPRRVLEIMFQVIERYKLHEKQRTAADWEALAHEYVADLGHFSEAHILEALVEHRRQSKWFPHQSELIPICERLAGHDKLLRRRGQVLLGQREPYSWERLPPQLENKDWISTDQMREKREKIIAQFPSRPIPPPPTIGEDAPRIGRTKTIAEILSTRDHASVEKLRTMRKAQPA